MTDQIEIKENESFLAFLDTLGSVDAIRENCLNGTSKEHFLRCRTAMVKALDRAMLLSRMYNIQQLYTYNTLSFSDNICLNIKWNEAELQTKMLKLPLIMIGASTLYYQQEMLKHELFIRGGISFGEVFIDDKYISGIALVDAYGIESKKAIYPRVLVDEKLYAEIKSLCKVKEDSMQVGIVKSLYVLDSCNNLFVNYLFVSDNHAENREKSSKYQESLLKKHKTLVQEKLEEYYEKIKQSTVETSRQLNMKILEKYIWVANYHDFYVANFVNPQEGNDRLGIDKLFLINEPIKHEFQMLE